MALIEEPGQFGVLAEALAQALPHLSLSALGHVPTLRLGQSGRPELAAAWKTPVRYYSPGL